MQLTKTQVLALFLGAASAEGELAHINGPTSADTVPAGQALRTASGGAACNAVGGCDADGESCGRFQRATGDPVDLCVNRTEVCGQLGRIAGVAYIVSCWTAVAEGETPAAPVNVDPAAYMTEIEALITKTTVNWDGETDMIVSPKFNWQDGWWLKQSDGKWFEVDKPADNRCFLDLQCPEGSCCSFYPDTNNRRCILKTEHNEMTGAGPLSFTPTCASLVDAGGDTPDDPTSAQDDLDKQALADASEELSTWNDNLKKDAQDAAGYDTMTDDEKATWDQEWGTEMDKERTFKKELMADAGYDEDTCDDKCKSVFTADLLKWKKEKYETCKADKDSIACRKADDIKKDVEKNRGKDYYTGSAEDRSTKDEAQKEKTEALESQLAAAWREDNKPAAGTSGGACSAEQSCDLMLCCGNSTPKAGQKFATENLTSICASALTLVYEDDLGNEYTHVCNDMSTRLTAAVAAAAAAATVATSLM